MKIYFKTAALLIMTSCMFSAQATTFNVSARDNSSTGGIGLETINVIAGQQYSITADPNDLWNVANGIDLAWSNANGISAVFPSPGGTDASGDILPAAGTSLSLNGFPKWTQNKLTANYGSLVGQIDNSGFFLIGTSLNLTPITSGKLKLYFFDSVQSDNIGSVNVNIPSAVPLPAAFWMMASSLLGLIYQRKRKVS